ncbi:hypothetical protein JQ574_28970 [Bradyrhizobium sp. AUGA SZCCT0158]|uniref:hypothetical protein n=1 Tax=Bradyrhizobium sp. AUGA SZCCT0158 TaxID=2807661 RepID=UPI001BA764E3|nr:hypothetical protein [Bradyrhizobium sp. AUGA SZCCT0158]MBR1200030.1 hypothetical protein [Bradyrhizobium sp. AUGA SZCCT0158]
MANVSVKSPDNSAKIKRFLPPPSQKFFAKEVQRAAATGEERRQRSEARQAELPDLQHLQTSLQAAIQSPKRDNAIERDLEAQIKEIKDRWAAEDAEQAARDKDYMNNATPSAVGILEPWIRLDLKTHQTAFNYFEELPAGMTERGVVDMCRELDKPLKAKRAAILKTPQTTAETAAVIAAAVERMGQKTILNVRSVRFLDYNLDRDKFEQRPFKLPNVALFDGVGKALSIPDAMGLLCLLFPEEITDRLTALAMNGERDDSGAMNRGDREAALDAVDAEILANDRRGEFWIRVCRAKNIAGGPRWTQDPRAILDLA